MPSFGKKSLEAHQTLKSDLQRLLDFLIQYVDFSIVEGYRPGERQHQLFITGDTTLDYPPGGNHNRTPSDAVDIVPHIKGLGQIWPDPDRDPPHIYREKLKIFAHLMGMVRMASIILEIPVRLGYDWDGDFSTLDQSFHDLPHIELVNIPRGT